HSYLCSPAPMTGFASSARRVTPRSVGPVEAATAADAVPCRNVRRFMERLQWKRFAEVIVADEPCPVRTSEHAACAVGRSVSVVGNQVRQHAGGCGLGGTSRAQRVPMQ